MQLLKASYFLVLASEAELKLVSLGEGELLCSAVQVDGTGDVLVRFLILYGHPQHLGQAAHYLFIEVFRHIVQQLVFGQFALEVALLGEILLGLAGLLGGLAVFGLLLLEVLEVAPGLLQPLALLELFEDCQFAF